MTRKRWIVGFLAATGLALGAELWASWDDSAATVPWTELIVQYVPGEVTAAVIGALMAWVPLHFGLRYWRRRKQR
jgi:hypothetical protein